MVTRARLNSVSRTSVFQLSTKGLSPWTRTPWKITRTSHYPRKTTPRSGASKMLPTETATCKLAAAGSGDFRMVMSSRRWLSIMLDDGEGSHGRSPRTRREGYGWNPVSEVPLRLIFTLGARVMV